MIIPQKYGCIYTGDGNLNQVDIRTVYKRFMPNVETVQITHHGSLENFNISSLANQGYYRFCHVDSEVNNFLIQLL